MGTEEKKEWKHWEVGCDCGHSWTVPAGTKTVACSCGAEIALDEEGRQILRVGGVKPGPLAQEIAREVMRFISERVGDPSPCACCGANLKGGLKIRVCGRCWNELKGNPPETPPDVRKGEGAEQQCNLLGDYITKYYPDDIMDGGAGDVAIEVIEKLQRRIHTLEARLRLQG